MKALLSIFSILLIGCVDDNNTANVNGHDHWSCIEKAVDDPEHFLEVEDCHYDKELRCHACVFVYPDYAVFKCVPHEVF